VVLLLLLDDEVKVKTVKKKEKEGSQKWER